MQWNFYYSIKAVSLTDFVMNSYKKKKSFTTRGIRFIVSRIAHREYINKTSPAKPLKNGLHSEVNRVQSLHTKLHSSQFLCLTTCMSQDLYHFKAFKP
jgi:hypothetical protein